MFLILMQLLSFDRFFNMGVSIEVWRGRIGTFHGKSFTCCRCCGLLPSFLPGLISAIHIFMIIYVHLVIGNIEMNPGPVTPINMRPCSSCPFKAMTPEQHIYHQQVHSGTFNFRFVCPFSLCHHTYDNYRSLSAHLSHHSTRRDEVAGNVNSFKCAYCDAIVKTNRDYCKHLKETHLDKGVEIMCPLSMDNCSRTAAFTTKSVFSVHLSQCHPGWLQDYSSSALQGLAAVRPADAEMEMECADDNLENAMPVDHVVVPMDFNEGGQDTDESERDSDAEESDDSADSNSSDGEGGGMCFDHDQIVCFLANFYALMEGKLIVPYSTVDEIAKRLSFISEILQNKLKNDLTKALTSLNISEKNISTVLQSVLSMDPLYNAHHRNAPGPCFLTCTRRQTYYKDNFKYQLPTEINLKKNPHDMEDTIQYINIIESTEIMLEDETVQKAVDESFVCDIPEDAPVIIRDYTDGSVFRSSNTPRKRIDIFIYMDAYNCCESLGSAKLKHKMNGMYMTLGNLKPYMRTFLKSMKLVLIINDKSLKVSESRFKKCFKRLMTDLQFLETNGILYKGEMIPVRVQFIQGDNLGQHTLGGFNETFSSIFFCRFCHLSRPMYKEDQEEDYPVFRTETWRTPASFSADLQVALRQNENYRGIKRDSPFHQLQHFKVCEPRLPPCIGHDIFIDGVVDRDVASIINYFIETKAWFTQEQLNNRIKRFKYLGNDGRNKPAPVQVSKLGGHAVQNWTLFRLLPILIGDLVETDDEMWKLYLLLKSIVELMCAPALTTDQIEVMRVLIDDYMGKRKVLGNKYKPKHHFFSHYPDLYLMFGPLIFMWTLAFEHRHQFFKRVSKICRNFINLAHLLAYKFQLLQAYLSMGPLFPEEPVFSHSCPLNEAMYGQDLSAFLKTCNFSANAADVKNLQLNEIKYNKGQWLLLGKAHNNNDIFVGKIEVLVSDEGSCKAVVTRYQAQKWEEYGLYKIIEASGARCVVSLDDGSLENPCPHAVYCFKGQLCLSLKHVFLDVI